MMKRLISIVLAVVLAVGLMPALAFAGGAGSGLAAQDISAQATVESGCASAAARTEEGLKAAWEALPEQPHGDAIYQTPNDNGAYAPATLTDGALAYAKAYLNFIRLQAGLSPVELDGALNASAAQGALILARLNDPASPITHFPATPAGVADGQAKAGKYACATSNLSYAASSPSLPDALPSAIQGQVDDRSGSNLRTLGHRRWLLNPSLSAAGIGCASCASPAWNQVMTSVRVFNDPLSEYYDASYGAVGSEGSTDYDFVAWPASGAFASNVFSMGNPWSVTLNEGVYKDPSAEGVSVTVTRASDGASWTMTSADSAPSNEQKFLLVNDQGYGVGNCIIFNPGGANVGGESYEGAYNVTVSGLEKQSGEPAALSYDVNFFALPDKAAAGDAADEAAEPGADKAANPMTVSGKKVTVKAKKKTVLAASKAVAVRKAQGEVTYAKLSAPKRIAKKVKVSSSGKITVKKGARKGAYKVKVRVTAAGNDAYEPASKVATVTLRVK